MADSTIKPDTGNDLVLQNNGGGTKIEIPNSGNIAVTGTLAGNVTVGSGKTLDVSSGTLTLADDQISGDKISGGTIGAGTFNGTIGTSATGFGLITDADQWRLTAEITGSAGFLTTSNMEQSDDAEWGHIGSDMSYSSGVFTFPKTGIWWILASFSMRNNSSSAQNYGGGYIQGTTNNSDYYALAFTYTNFFQANAWGSSSTNTFIDCTNTSTHKVKMYRDVSDSDIAFKGSSTDNMTCFTFIRIGDT